MVEGYNIRVQPILFLWLVLLFSPNFLFCDRLLTPPGTPLVPSTDGNESQTGLMAPRNGPLVRSRSTAKASRVCQPVQLYHNS